MAMSDKTVPDPDTTSNSLHDDILVAGTQHNNGPYLQLTCRA